MSLFENVTTWQDAYSKLYLQYTMLELDTEISNHMIQLAKETANTITKMPMRYTGKEDYEIFKLGSYSMRKIPKNHQFNREFLLNFFDTFSIRRVHQHGIHLKYKKVLDQAGIIFPRFPSYRKD
jgi:hypothetical protein